MDSVTENYKEFIKNNKLICSRHFELKSIMHLLKTFIYKISFCTNDYKKIQSTSSTETYAYGTSKDSKIFDYSYKILITGAHGSGKANELFNLIGSQPGIDQIYLFAKDPYEAKYQLLINKSEGVGLKEYNDSKAFVEYSNDMDDKNIEEHNPDKKHKVLTVFDNMIADILSNKKLNSVVT